MPFLIAIFGVPKGGGKKIIRQFTRCARARSRSHWSICWFVYEKLRRLEAREMADAKSEVGEFDHSKLKHVETAEKNPLPTKSSEYIHRILSFDVAFENGLS